MSVNHAVQAASSRSQIPGRPRSASAGRTRTGPACSTMASRPPGSSRSPIRRSAATSSPTWWSTIDAHTTSARPSVASPAGSSTRRVSTRCPRPSRSARAAACSSIVADPSTATTLAAANCSAKWHVPTPGPHPMSSTRRTSTPCRAQCSDSTVIARATRPSSTSPSSSAYAAVSGESKSKWW